MSLLAPSIVIVDVDVGISEPDRVRAADALTRQVLEHFAPLWGVMACVRGDDRPSRVGEWRVELRKVPTIDGALGFHDRQPDGTPILYVFPELCAEDGTTWTSCASHEILEALADPALHRCVELPDGRVAAVEVADQVEADTYQIDGVTVSNFNTPDNFEPPAAGAIRFDYLGLQTAAFEVRPGGYAQVYADGGWMQIGTASRYRQKLAELGLSRTKRRR